jgi:hypothetical protein
MKHVQLFEQYMNESSKYDIQFTDNKQDIVNLLLSLNKNKDFKIKQLNDNEFKIIYDGGYNNVYNYKVILKIIGLTQNIHNKWFYWKFELTSKLYHDYIEVDNFGWDTGFMDFFIDSFIKDIGNMINNQD